MQCVACGAPTRFPADGAGAPVFCSLECHGRVSKRTTIGAALPGRVAALPQANVRTRRQLNEAFLHGAARGNAVAVQFALADGVPINTIGIEHKTALFLALENHHHNIAIALLAQGADVNISDFQGVSPLMLMARLGNVDVVRRLLAANARIHNTDFTGKTALFYAISYRHNGVVKVLLQNGADANGRDDSATTPLMLAAGKGSIKVVHTLLAAGATATINALNSSGESALSNALVYRSVAYNNLYDSIGIAKILLDAGADGSGNSPDGTTPLMDVVRHNNLELANVLITLGVDEAALDQHHKTALIIAIELGRYDVARALSKNPASVNVADRDGATPLILACRDKKVPVDFVRALLDAGADVRKEDSKGHSALWEAIKAKNADVVRLLAQRFAVFALTKRKRERMLEHARYSRAREIVEILNEFSSYEMK